MIAALKRIGDEGWQQWSVRNWKFITFTVLATGVASAAVYSLACSGRNNANSDNGSSARSSSTSAKKKKMGKTKKSKTASSTVTAASALEEEALAANAGPISAPGLNASMASLDSIASIETTDKITSETNSKSDESKTASADASNDVESHDHLYPEDIESLTSEDRSKLAQDAKALGNKQYNKKKFEEAIELYTQAILLAPNAIFYCNRAAAYSHIENFAKVVEDCTKALELDKKYIKALNRRAAAYESLGHLTDALNDYTVVCVLQGFKVNSSMSAPDRLLKTISSNITQEYAKSRRPKMPSGAFVRAYMDSFRATPSHATLVDNCQDTSESIQALKLVFSAIKEHRWTEAYEHAVKAIVLNDFNNTKMEAIAHNIRGTFFFLIGHIDLSIADLDKALELDPVDVNSIIKRGTLFMERSEVEKTVEMFERAEKLEPTNVDLFYHRGQVRFLTADYQGAVDDYSASIKNESPEESSVYVHIQMAVAKYKLGNYAESEKKFKECKRLFPNSAEVFNYYGEIHMDRQAHTEALKAFNKSIEMDPTSPLPYINKAILYLNWKQDLATAEAECRKALEVDPLCDIAYSQLAQLLCHQHKLDEAIQVYDKAITVTRTDIEVLNVVTYREAARAQKYASMTYPEAVSNISQA
ncbi:hypothetical protein BATDEDRAFT_19105 [Batrachochytrium dendrobatidis JAM81]|uniref:Mitochondrial import receptor subunit TOM70 n=1 Tax=Batrachochytrium dendrobatidis (strain JAM81 / FGSC 10211) TaxID=684364 RepID=F4NY34_BATDJ|nr:uncharacterized protein BATDEDRAFT_19105 [Batrachochytrium dendrobatidis JAM81]EGF82256.1 hypothetical protein BATDEDRAFT_19105 [Batrachochytrium dendrobatidis JAM81]KAJ8324393.1 TOM (translocase of outer membrane) complex component [Batrachochytrium dendrobatidis]KAK5670646.1 TOM (translocase of outer membrane) complex component [Batrachochytrium dendrobatidis]|eukprot:XP_006677213.1 hypothetical protein BATDEDRAFT_19105 [Batrachochytrium dendrobatidis JAM81]